MNPHVPANDKTLKEDKFNKPATQQGAEFDSVEENENIEGDLDKEFVADPQKQGNNTEIQSQRSDLESP